MKDARIESLERRLRRAERRGRLVIVTALACAAAQLWQDDDGEVLRVERVEIVNEHGRAVCILGSNEFGGELLVKGRGGLRRLAGVTVNEGGGYVFVADASKVKAPVAVDIGVSEDRGRITVAADGKPAGTFGAQAEGGYVALVDADGVDSAYLMSGEEGGILGLMNQQGDDRLNLWGGPSGGSLRLLDERGETFLESSTFDNGRPFLELYQGAQFALHEGAHDPRVVMGAGSGSGLLNLRGGDGTLGVLLGARAEGAGTLRLGEEDGQWSAQLNGSSEKGGSLVVHDGAGKLLAGLSVDGEVSGLVLYDADGEAAAWVERGEDGGASVAALDAQGEVHALVED